MGMSGDTALALAKSYVKKTLQGQGALKGQDGFSPTITENADNTDKIYKLDITTANSAFTTPNLRGKDGEGSGGGEANVIESISVNGTPISVDENKNVDITVPSIDGLAKKEDIPTKVSELTNDSKYQTESDVTTTLSDYATKTYVGEQIANAEHLKREIVTVLPSDTEASDNIIYMLKVESATGNDKYQEYMKIDGTVQMVGDTSVDLTDYAKTTEIPTTVAELTDSDDYAKKTDIPTTLPANGGNADTVNNHTVESDVPVDAKFTDTVYDDTGIKEEFTKVDNKLTTNLLKPTMGTTTQNGITCTNNGDGTFTLNDANASANDAWFNLSLSHPMKKGKYKLVGCPSGGGDWTTYFLSLGGDSVITDDGDKKDFGNGKVFEVTEDSNIAVLIWISGIKNLGNVIVKPMITTNINATYDDFVPYTGSTGQLNSDVAEVRKEHDEDIEEVNESLSVIGKCKNLLKPTMGTTTQNGVTCTNNGDGTYTLNGTATKTTDITLCAINIKNNKSYMCVGCPSGGSTNSYYLYFDFFVDSTWKKVLNDTGNGVKLDNTEYNIVKPHIKILSGQTVSNLVFKPMLTTNLNATYDDFVPYTGDGDTLMADVADINNDLGGLSFSVSDGTLSITDGTNTWTLPQTT